MEDGKDLEVFIDELIRRAGAKGYSPTVFLQMRERWGTREAVRRLVISGDIQSGLRRLQDLNLLDWSIEAAALKFPAYFDKGTRDAAQFRLDQVRAGV
jgi:hypothetical protein